MKNILISGKVIADKYNQIGEFLDEAWINYFKNKKINLINCSMLTNQLLKKLRISGVILTGGNDLYKIKKKRFNKIRDSKDSKLFNFAISNNIPVLGVCRGFQFIASKMGGTINKKKGHVKKKHILKVNDKIFNQEIEKIIINSFHDYVVTKLSKKFRKTYQLSDKSIELAISNNKKILLMMFHPERKNISDKIIKKIIFDFFKI